MEILPLQPRHVREIVARNGNKVPNGVSLDEMIKAYLSEGSLAYCLVDNGEVIFAAGMINLQWKRCEAWVLHTDLFNKHLKTCMKILKAKTPELAKLYKFRRVQATSFISNGRLFDFLGFELECAEMKLYGPSGETATSYVRFFE